MIRNLALIFLLSALPPAALNERNGMMSKSNTDEISIVINTVTGEILLDSKPLRCMNADSLSLLLGKPGRIEKYTRKERYERMPYNGEGQPYSTMREVTDTYYLYDKLGIMFYTTRGWGEGESPCALAVFFGNKRSFDNRESPPYTPTNSFTGTLTINNILLDPAKNMVKDSVDYRTSETLICGAGFGPTSIGGIIDGFYSTKSEVYMLIYLDKPETQRPSYMEISLPE